MRILTSIILIIILVLITPVFLLVTSLKVNVLHTTFLKHQLQTHDVYALAFAEINNQIGEVEIPSDFPITHEEVATLVNQVFTPAWLQQNVEQVLDSFDAWLDAPAGADLSLVVSLAEPKAALVSQLDVFLTGKLATLEPCDPQLPEAERGICQFAGRSLEEVKAELAHNGIDPDMITKLLPDQLDLVNPDISMITGESDKDSPDGAAAKSAEIRNNLELVKSYYQLGVHFFWYAWVLYAALLAEFVVLNATRGWRRLVRWCGVMFLSIGLLPTALGIASFAVMEQVLLPKIQLGTDFPSAFTGLVPDLIADAQSAVFTLPLAIGGALVVLGLSGIIGAHWLPTPKSPFVNKKIEGLKA